MKRKVTNKQTQIDKYQFFWILSKEKKQPQDSIDNMVNKLKE